MSGEKWKKEKKFSTILPLKSLLMRVDLLAGMQPVARVMPHGAHRTSTPAPGSKVKTEDELNS